MAAVYKARQLSLNRVVALKVVTYKDAPDRDLIERFRQETHIAATVNHPGIVQIYDAGEHEHVAYCVMEFVEGETLGQRLRRAKFIDQDEALRIADGVAQALRYAWEEARLIHCDIKPDNILIDKKEVVKVSDLGVARIIGRAMPNLDEGMIIGTPYYSSPEQSAGVTDLDTRTDIYALAATLYQAVTGRLPFADVDELGAIEKHTKEFLPDPWETNQQLKPSFLALLDRMMAKDRRLRQANWVEVHRDIGLAKEGRMPEGKAVEPGQSTVTISPKRPKPPRLKPKISTPAGAKPIPVGEPRRRIVLTEEFKDASAQKKPAQRSNVVRALVTLAVLASIAVLFYGGAFKMLPGMRGNTTPNPDPAPVPSDVPTPGPEPGPVVQPDPDPTPAPEPVWDSKRFDQARNMLVKSDQAYQRYLQQREDPSALELIEGWARQAIQELEAIRSETPASAEVGELIRKGYQLISQVRQTKLLAEVSEEMNLPGSGSDHVAQEFEGFVEKLLGEEAEPMVTPGTPGVGSVSPPPDAVVAPSPEPVVREPARPLTMAQNWNRPLMGGKKYILDDLTKILRYQGRARVDLEPKPGILVYKNLQYLMPIKEAVKALGQPLPARNLVNTYGLPSNTLHYYRMTGSFEGGYNQLILVTDSEAKLIAAQLINEPATGGSRMRPANFSSDNNTYDFMLGRAESGGRYSVGYEVVKKESILIVDTELKSTSRGDLKARTRLFLPQPIVDLFLFRLRNQ